MADVDHSELIPLPAPAVPSEKSVNGVGGSVSNDLPATEYIIPPYSKDSSIGNLTVDGSKDPAKTPFLQAVSRCKPSASASLTQDQIAKYESLLSTVKSWTDVPDTLAAKVSRSPLTDSERMWLTKDCLLRYLRASKWILSTAATRLQATLSWRRECRDQRYTSQ